MWKDEAYLLDMLLAARDVSRFLQGADHARFQSEGGGGVVGGVHE